MILKLLSTRMRSLFRWSLRLPVRESFWDLKFQDSDQSRGAWPRSLSKSTVLDPTNASLASSNFFAGSSPMYRKPLSGGATKAHFIQAQSNAATPRPGTKHLKAKGRSSRAWVRWRKRATIRSLTSIMDLQCFAQTSIVSYGAHGVRRSYRKISLLICTFIWISTTRSY